MARTRTIKPDFWTDERLAECSPSARLLFVGTWNFADDCGNLPRSSKKLKMQIFPGDDFDCEPLVQELLAEGLLIEYTVDGEKYLNIKGFSKHQKIDHPSKTTIPSREIGEDSPRTHRVLAPDRVEQSRVEENRIEKKEVVCSLTAKRQGNRSSNSEEKKIFEIIGDEEKDSEIPEKAIFKLSEKFELPEEWGKYAEKFGWSPENILRESEKFKAYWTVGKGCKRRRNKRGWRQCWSNWIEKASNYNTIAR